MELIHTSKVLSIGRSYKLSNKPLKRDELKRRMTTKKKRKEGSKLVQPKKYLIICEGTKTEPYYFKGMQKRIEEKYDKRIKVELTVEGAGRNCLSLLEYAKTIVKNEKKQGQEYDHVWLVYDLDDFPKDNFDNTAYSVESMNKSEKYSE